MVSPGLPNQGKLKENTWRQRTSWRTFRAAKACAVKRRLWKGNYRNTNVSSSFFLPAANCCAGSAPLGLTRLSGPAPLCFCKKNYASVQTKQEREEQKRKTKPVLVVQCWNRKKNEKKKEISNEEPKESAGGKNLQVTTGSMNSARKDLSSSCFIAHFVSERPERACQGCRWRFSATAWSWGKSGIFLWVTG